MTADRQALNRCFWDLGLRFQWDEETWAVLSGMKDVREQLAYYLSRHQPHLLAVYDLDFLAKLIEERLLSPAPTRIGIEAHASF
jgi:hypothetical protein